MGGAMMASVGMSAHSSVINNMMPKSNLRIIRYQT